MDIALLLVNCKSDIIIARSLLLVNCKSDIIIDNLIGVYAITDA